MIGMLLGPSLWTRKDFSTLSVSLETIYSATELLSKQLAVASKLARPPEEAIHRELKEELGASVEVLCKIGTVSDYYNQIHRHNVNHYFLCLVTSFGKTEMTSKELEEFELSTLKLTYEEAFEEYKRCAAKPWGVLLANRELPVLEWANQWYSIKE